jgi:predicted DNA-binding protein
MAEDTHILQIRVGLRLRNQVQRLSERFGLTGADVVRGSLELGVRTMEKLLEAQEITVKEYLRLLKAQYRKGRITSVDSDDDISLPERSREHQVTP